MKDLKIFKDGLENMVSLVNLYKKPLDKKILDYYRNRKETYKGQNIFKMINQELQDQNMELEELINTKIYDYESL